MSDAENRDTFELGEGFEAGQISGGIDLGPHAGQYRELFADALEDGVITTEERERLDEAAENLGMDRLKIQQLEKSMIQAYEATTRVKVVEKWEAGPASLQPIDVKAAGDEGRLMLLKQIHKLTARITELEEELREARSHVHVEVDLLEFEELEVADESLDTLRARIRRDPTGARHFANLYKACGQAGDSDGQFRAAQALVVLGKADSATRDLVRAHGSDGLISPQRSLDLPCWQDALSHPDLEIVTSKIMALVAPAALVGRSAALRRDKKLPSLPDSKKQDAQTSTVAAVRALGWAATVLGMPTPTVFADPERNVGYVCVPALPPFSLLGKPVLRGLSPAEQAFLTARHMTYYRAEFFTKVLFPGVQALENLFLAALLLGSPSLPVAEHLQVRVKPLSDALAPLMSEWQMDTLRQQFKAFVADGGRTNLLRWSDSVDKTACRAGLLLSNDLGAAATLLEQAEGARGPLLSDLLAFSASEPYGVLRQHLGIALSCA